MEGYNIKVKDLIEELKKYDPNGEVILNVYIDTKEICDKGKTYIATNDTQNYELNIHKYEYEDDDGQIVTSKDIVFTFDIN